MNCIKCYQEIPDGAKFCPYCGAQQSDTSATDPVRAEETVTEPVQAAQTEEVPTEPVQMCIRDSRRTSNSGRTETGTAGSSRCSCGRREDHDFKKGKIYMRSYRASERNISGKCKRFRFCYAGRWNR